MLSVISYFVSYIASMNKLTLFDRQQIKQHFSFLSSQTIAQLADMKTCCDFLGGIEHYEVFLRVI